MLSALDHLIVAVRDLAAAEKLTTAVLGREPSWRGRHPGEGTANALYRLENTYLELVTPTGGGGAGALLQAHLDTRGEGLIGLAFATGDAEAVRRAWAERGLEPGEVTAGRGVEQESGVERAWRRVLLPGSASRGVLLFAIEHLSPPEALPAVAPGGPPEAAVHGLDHVVVRTADPEAAIALYRDGLGLRLALDREFEAWGVRLIFFRIGGLTVEVAAALAPASGLPETPQGRDALWGVTWQVADVDAARVRVREAGLDVSEVRAGRRPGTRVCTVRGEPCGVATLLIQPPA